MLLILATLYFFNNSISAAPVSHVLRDAIPPDLNSPASQCICPDQQRSLWDILWSCLATIFACTWVSVHPNIPPSGERWWKTVLRRLELMFWALIAPELIILWAMKQWCGARGMVKKYHGYRWTMTHAHFIQMGGFTLFEGAEPSQVLLPERMEQLLLAGQIDLPQITEGEIRDRSKGDGLSKALVIGQTTWFIAQCITRQTQGLILTELELVTGAFAVLNGVMYFLWWNKPLDVQCSVPVYLLDKAKEPFVFESAEKSMFSLWGAISIICYRPIEFFAHTVTVIWESMWKTLQQVNLRAMRGIITTIIISPWTITHVFFSRLGDILVSGGLTEVAGFVSTVSTFHAEDIMSSGDLLELAGSVSTVSTFYASADYTTTTTKVTLVPSIVSVISALFGGLHCAEWFFAFPSLTEMIIWRVCSVVISIIPLVMLFTYITDFGFRKAKSGSVLLKKFFKILAYTFGILSIICLPIYAIARLLLLGDAFAALRRLPPDALVVVDWLSFLPHI